MSYSTLADPPLAPVAADRAWGAVAASTIGLVFSLGTLLLYTFGVFARPLLSEFGWSRFQLSGALAVSQYTFALSAPVWGLLIDRYGPRAIIVPSVICMSFLVASLSTLSSLWQYYLTFLAVSFCAGGASPIGYSAVLVRRFDRHLGLALGLALMGVGIGAAVLPPLSAFIMTSLGWRYAYAALGLLTFVFTLPAALIVTRGIGCPTRAAKGALAQSIRPLVVSRPFILMNAIFLLLGIVSIGTLTSIVPMMISRGFSAQEAAQIAGVTGLVAIAGRGGIGWVLDRVHPPYVIAGIATIALGAFLLVAYGTGTSAAYLTAALLGAVVGAEVDFTAFFVRRYFGGAVFGRLYGLAFGIFIVGSGTGPLVSSAMFDAFKDYRPGALLFAAGAIVIVLLTFAMPAVKPSMHVAKS